MNLEEIIIDLAKKNHLTAYEISKNTSISINTVRNVLTDSKIKTKQKTLNIILEYLEKTIVGTTGELEIEPKYSTKNRANIAAEEGTNYNLEFNNLKIDDKLNIIYNQNLEQAKNIDLLFHLINTSTLITEKTLLDFEIIKNNQVI
jgi:hypothetical protein